MTADVHLLPGVRLSSEVVLHQALEEINDIKSICMVIQFKDGTFEVRWSGQKISELCMGAMILDQQIREEMICL